MPRRAKYALGAIEALESRWVLSTVNWTGLAGTFDWNTPGNWSSSPLLPGAGDDVVINVGGNPTIQHASGTATIQSLTAANSITLSGGSIAVSAASTISGSLLLSGGALNGGPNGLTLSGATSWTDGTLAGSVTNASTGTLTISGATTKSLSGTLTNAGTITVASGAGYVQGNSSSSALVNQAGATIDIQSDGTAFYALYGGTLTNAGTIQKSAGPGISTVTFKLNSNGGVIAVNSGTISATGGGTLDGALSVTGGTLDLSLGTFTAPGTAAITVANTLRVSTATLTLANGASIAGPGRLQVNGGTLSLGSGSPVNVSVANLALDLGVVNGNGTITGAKTWTGGTISGLVTNAGTLTVSGAGSKNLTGTLTNAGTVTIATGAGSIIGTLSAAVVNQAGATFDIQSDGSVFSTYSNGYTLTNAGTLQKSAGAGTTTLGLGFVNNAGTVRVQVGTFRLPSLTGSLTGNNLTGGTYLINGVLQVDNADIQQNGATIVLDGAGAQFQNPISGNVSALANLNTITAGGSLTLRNGAGLPTLGSLANFGALTLGAGSTLNAAGFNQDTGGSLSLELGGSPASGQFGQVATTGVTQLAGTLNVNVANNYAPSSGDSYPVMNFASSTGWFSTINNQITNPLVPPFQAVQSATAVNILFANSGTTTSLNSSLNPSTYGGPLVFTATVSAIYPPSGTPTGAVQFYVDGTPLGAAVTLVNGVASSPSVATLGAGSHTITANYSGDSFHTASTGSTNQQVNQAPLTITADNKGRLYGQANPTFTATYSGFVNGEGSGVLGGTLVLTTSAIATSPVGGYAIVPSGQTSSNYAITFVNGTLTVGQAPLTITADNKGRLYGQANPAFTASYSGFVNGEGSGVLGGTLVLTTSAIATSPVGGYAIVPSGQTSSNYAITFANGTLTVGQAPLTITADNKGRLYGQANPAFTASYSGFVNGENSGVLGGTLVLTTSATATSPVGGYAIVPSGQTSSNYAITFVNGTLTVGQAHLTVTADDMSRGQGTANPTLTYTISGFANGENASVVTGSASLSTTATISSPAGIYPITATLGTLAAANYDFNPLVPGNLTVRPVVNDVRVHWGSQSASILPANLGGRLTIPWDNITGIDVIFSDNVVVASADMTLTGVGGHTYAFSGFGYNSATHDASWTLPTALGIDRLTIQLNGQTGIHTPSNIFMGDYSLNFAVLPGDVNGDGVVDSADMGLVRAQIQGIGDPSLLIWANIDGNGVVDLNDYNAVRRRIGNQLPPL